MREVDGTEAEWLSLGAASRLLGVNPDSLRRWANAGRIDCITTPGGHRRFSRRSLERILEPRNIVEAEARDRDRHAGGDGHANGPARSDLPGADRAHLANGPHDLESIARTAIFAGTAPLVAAAYRRSYARTLDVPRSTAPAGTRPSGGISEVDRHAFRVDGRRLLAALLRALDATDDAVRADAEAEAMGIAGTHARRLAEARVPLAEAVRMFVRARRPFLAEIRSIAHRQHLDPASVLVLYDDASGLLDRLLLAFVAAHGATPPTARSASRRTPS